MTMMSDLPQDLEEQILSRVPITSLRAVRSTCKQWNHLFKDGSFIKNHRGNEFLAIKGNGSKVCLMSINLHKNQPLKRIGEIKLGYTSRFIHCNGLLLFVPGEGNTAKLMVWNPYLGQTRQVKQRRAYGRQETYGFGYDKNKNHKILRLVYGLMHKVTHEIYNLNSNSWKVHSSPSAILGSIFEYPSVSVKGSSYFLTKENGVGNAFFLHGFDFTREAFGARLELPYLSEGEEYPTALSALREEKLVLLLRRCFSYTLQMQIWITDKVEPNAVSWNKLLAFNFATVTCYNYMVYARRGFFVDEEKKVVVFSEMTEYGLNNKTCGCIIGEDGYFKKVDLGEEFSSGGPFVCYYYAPSLVQIQPT